MQLLRPHGAVFLDNLIKGSSINRRKFHQFFVLGVTFILYFVFHLTRRPLSIVKSQLHRNCSQLISQLELTQLENITNPETFCNWAPFDTEDANSLLGLLDTNYLISYALFMFIAGYVAERSNLRYFLSISLIFCGLICFLFGISYNLQIHELYYFIIIQILAGVAQACGWPAVVATIGNWFGSSKKGLIFGIWNSHSSFGNIAGAAIAGAFVETNWGLSFIVPGIIACVTATLVFLFLIPGPQDVGIPSESNDDKLHDIELNDKLSISEESKLHVNECNDKPTISEGHSAISFLGALKIPGVIEFSICLFFAKLVSYTFLYWLPLYITDSTKRSSSESAYMSISFDMGGMVGAMAAGYIADISGASAITCNVMLTIAIPSLYLYYLYGTAFNGSNELLQFIAGIFVNGPYSLITTAVSTELATKVPSHSAMATVSAIINGTGSIGAALGPALAGIVSNWGWNYVFYMVMFADFLALVSLLRIGFNEFIRLKKQFFKECNRSTH